ncbi:hypothetical protein ACMD2_22702, partial [Ananas comosus]
MGILRSCKDLQKERDILQRQRSEKCLLRRLSSFGLEKHANEMMSQNRSLLKHWCISEPVKAIVLEVLNHLDKTESLDKKIHNGLSTDDTSLVTILYLTYLNTGIDTHEFATLLLYNNLLGDLPRAFSEKLRHVIYSRTQNYSRFLSAFADALETIGNPLVVISSTGRSSTLSKLNAVFISPEQIRDPDRVCAMLFLKILGNVKDKESSQDSSNMRSSCSPSTGIERNKSGNQQTSLEKSEGHQRGNVEE